MEAMLLRFFLAKSLIGRDEIPFLRGWMGWIGAYFGFREAENG